jgi:hypothetical protein
MTGPGHPIELAIDVSGAEVRRNLGYGRSGRPSGRPAERLEALWQPGIALVRARGVWTLVDRAAAERAGMPDPTDEVAVGLVTAGPALEAEVDRLNHEDELLDALLLDAIGSSAAEAAADALDRILCGEVARDQRFAARRISPGYGAWDVRHQRELLAMLPAAALGVTLTAGMMMIPRKSISFAVRLSSDRPRGQGRHRCAGCEMNETCAFRRV